MIRVLAIMVIAALLSGCGFNLHGKPDPAFHPRSAPKFVPPHD